MAPQDLVVVTGLLAEARLVKPMCGRVIASGGDPARLEAELAGALADGAQAVLSFGLAAGLEPQRAAGTLLVPAQVVSGTETWRADPDWSARLRTALGGAESRPLAGVDAPLIRPADKAQFHQSTGAVAADMESHCVARLALGAGRPFAVLRVISDPAERALPPAAVLGMKSDGRIALGAVLASLLRQPGQLQDLAQIARDARTAMSVLARCRGQLGPGLGWPQCGH